MVDTAGFPLLALIGLGSGIAAGMALLRLYHHTEGRLALPAMEPILIDVEDG